MKNIAGMLVLLGLSIPVIAYFWVGIYLSLPTFWKIVMIIFTIWYLGTAIHVIKNDKPNPS